MGDIVGIILAGGKSSRMGRDKTKLMFQGKNLVEYTKQLLKESGVTKIYVSGSEHVADLIPNLGPLGGIYSVIQKLPDNQEILILPIDMPLISSKLLKSLLEEKILTDAVYFEGFIMPLRLKLSNYIKKGIEELVTDKQKSPSIKALLNNLNITTLHVSADKEKYFLNANTPIDWKKAKETEDKTTS